MRTCRSSLGRLQRLVYGAARPEQEKALLRRFVTDADRVLDTIEDEPNRRGLLGYLLMVLREAGYNEQNAGFAKLALQHEILKLVDRNGERSRGPRRCRQALLSPHRQRQRQQTQTQQEEQGVEPEEPDREQQREDDNQQNYWPRDAAWR